jgi:hypothetical protein
MILEFKKSNQIYFKTQTSKTKNQKTSTKQEPKTREQKIFQESKNNLSPYPAKLASKIAIFVNSDGKN